MVILQLNRSFQLDGGAAGKNAGDLLKSISAAGKVATNDSGLLLMYSLMGTGSDYKKVSHHRAASQVGGAGGFNQLLINKLPQCPNALVCHGGDAAEVIMTLQSPQRAASQVAMRAHSVTAGRQGRRLPLKSSCLSAVFAVISSGTVCECVCVCVCVHICMHTCVQTGSPEVSWLCARDNTWSLCRRVRPACRWG